MSVEVEVGGICLFICLSGTGRHRGPVIEVLTSCYSSLARLHVVPCVSRGEDDSS
jgi:hypothetical protein